MGRARKISGRGSNTAGHDDSVTGGERKADVDRLRDDFRRFRQTHRLRARIPETLRKAALAALAKGTAEAEVVQACGVTSAQLAQWQKRLGACATRRKAQIVEPPLVFPVVDDGEDVRPRSAPALQAPELELRMGTWVISVRQLAR